MVTIKKEDSNFIFEVQGMHKVWAFKNSITIPAEHILRAYQDQHKVDGWRGWKFPGTNIPFVITAGTYYVGDEKNFWDVSNKEKCIVVDLADEKYDHLVVEVENPQAAIDLLTL